MSVPVPSADKPSAQAEAVARLFQEHNRALVRYLAVRLQSLQEAKEIAQEAYVRLLQLDRPGIDSFLKNYLYRVATNLAIDRLRQRGRRQTAEHIGDATLDDGLNTPEQDRATAEQVEAVVVALGELPPKCRDAFLRFRLDGIPQQRIAKELAVTERMVRLYITQATIYCRLRTEGLTAEQAKEQLKK